MRRINPGGQGGVGVIHLPDDRSAGGLSGRGSMTSDKRSSKRSMIRSELVQPDIADFVDDLSAGRVTCRIEVFGDGRLAIGHHLLAGEFLGVDEEARPSLPGNSRALMGMPLAIHPLTQSAFAQ